MKRFSIIMKEEERESIANINGWGMCEIGKIENYYFGDTVSELMTILEYSGESYKIYGIDLKYYGEFIFSFLYENEFRLIKDKKERENKTFTCLIGENGKLYSIDIYFNIEGKKKIKTTFYDIRNILDLDIDDICEDFLGERYNTNIEKEFFKIKYDAEILAKSIEILLTMGVDRMTIGSAALAEYKRTVDFERYYPILKEEIHRYLANSYKGGFVYLNPIYKSKLVRHGIVLDYNSGYPYVLKNCDLPYGEPIYFEGEYQKDRLYNLYITTFYAEFELKEGKLPTVQIKEDNEYNPTEYVTSSNGDPILLTMTNIDLELFYENYDISYIRFENGFKFRSISGLFDEYIDYWYEQKLKAKEEGNSSMYLLAKKMLNALYGKFGTSIDVINKYPYLCDDGSIEYIRTPKTTREPVYIATAAFTTAYVRDRLIRDCQKVRDYSIKKYNKDMYIYSDTDCISSLLPEEDLREIFNISKDELGAFKIEDKFTKGRYIKAKCYILEKEENKELKATVAGLAQRYMENKKANIKFNDFKSGIEIDSGAVEYRHVKGGVIRTQRTYKIK